MSSFALLMFSVFSGAPPSTVIIVIPEQSLTASAAAGHLRDELDVPARVEQTSSFDAQELAARARSAWPDAIVIMLNPEKNETWVARPNEAAILVRTLPSESDASPYALAVAAAELARIAMQEVRAEPRVEPIIDPEPSTGGDLELAAAIGLDVSSSPSLVRPIFGLDVHYRSNSLRSSGGLRVRALGQSNSGDAVSVDYTRTDLSLRLAFGPEVGDFVFLALFEGGVGLADVRAVRGANTLGAASRTPIWLSGGAELEYVLWKPLRVALSFELTRVLAPADFIGDDVVLFSDADWRVDSSFSVKWVLD